MLFTSKFWSLLCYFLEIKKKLSKAFHPQTNSQTEKQNSTMRNLRAIINWKQNNWAKLLPMAEFAYNNTKNVSIGHIPFELNCRFHLWVSFKEDVNPRFKSRSVSKLIDELKELIEIYCQNLLYAQELQKRAHDKGVKSDSYTFGKKIWLNSKYMEQKAWK